VINLNSIQEGELLTFVEKSGPYKNKVNCIAKVLSIDESEIEESSLFVIDDIETKCINMKYELSAFRDLYPLPYFYYHNKLLKIRKTKELIS